MTTHHSIPKLKFKLHANTISYYAFISSIESFYRIMNKIYGQYSMDYIIWKNNMDHIIWNNMGHII